MAKQITVTSGEESISLPLEPDGTLSIECLKTYFPHADGLVCEVRVGEITKLKGLSIKNGQIKIEPYVTEYKVHYCNTKSVQSNSSSSEN